MNREGRRKCKNSYEMARRIEHEIDIKTKNYYEKEYQKQLDNAIEIFILAIKYTLHFNEKTKFGNARIKDFMEDLLSTVDNFRTGEYSPEEYKEILKQEGIDLTAGGEKYVK